MQCRNSFVLGIAGLAILLASGCPAPEYKAAFEHKLNNPPPRVLIGAEYPYYRVGQWVEFSATAQRPQFGGWMAHEWSFAGPAGAGFDQRMRQDPDSGVSLSDKTWVKFHTAGKYRVQLRIKEERPLGCLKCGKPLPNLPYQPGAQIACPGCKENVAVPVFASGALPGSGIVSSKPEEILLIDIGPKRWVDNDPEKGEDLPLITIFPEGGWVYVGERLQASFYGVAMRTSTGGSGAFQELRVIKKIEVDFGDGSKAEGYDNPAKADEIQHRLIDHIYTENGHYEIKAVITDSKGETYAYTRQILAVDQPSSGMDRLVGNLVAKLLNSEIGQQLNGKNVIIYNLEQWSTYPDDGLVNRSREADSIQPLEDQMIQQFQRKGIFILERDEHVMRRWLPEVFGVLPNSFSRDLEMNSAADWATFGEKLKVDVARPDFLVEYRIVELNERLEPFRKFDPVRNRLVSVVEMEAGAAGRVTTIQRLEAKWRKRVLKLYFRILDGHSGPDSTRVLYTDVLTGTAEDFVVVPAPAAASQPSAAPAPAVQAAVPAERLVDCPYCKARNDPGDNPGNLIRCGKCGKPFPIRK